MPGRPARACVPAVVGGGGGTILEAFATFTIPSGTVTVGDSYNVTSLTDNGTGDVTVNFTSSFSNSNFSVSGIATKGSSSEGYAMSVTTRATSSVRTLSGYLTTSAIVTADDDTFVSGVRSVLCKGT